MKEVKILHINDGKSEVIANEERIFIETFPRAQAEIESLINDGWEVKQMNPQVTPAINREGVYSFYNSGFIVHLERDLK